MIAAVAWRTGATLLTMLFLPALYVAWFRINEPREEKPRTEPAAVPEAV